MSVDAMLLSAGFGKRLRPLTENIPKPLVEVAGKTLIERNLELLQKAQINRVFINLHYRGQQIREFVGDGSRWGLEAIYSEEEEILDTGGGIRKIAEFVQTPHLLTINSDVLIDPDAPIAELVRTHTQCPKLPWATMMLREDASAKEYGSLVVNQDAEVLRILNTVRPDSLTAVGGEQNGFEELMFAGIEVLSAKIFERMPPPGSKFSITQDTLCSLLSEGGLIKAFKYSGFWSDIGTPDRLQAASKDFTACMQDASEV